MSENLVDSQTIKRVGRFAKIFDRYIPVNDLDIDDEVYFEIVWPNAAMWHVHTEGDRIIVDEYKIIGGDSEHLNRGASLVFEDWRNFISLYDEKKLSY